MASDAKISHTFGITCNQQVQEDNSQASAAVAQVSFTTAQQAPCFMGPRAMARSRLSSWLSFRDLSNKNMKRGHLVQWAHKGFLLDSSPGCVFQHWMQPELADKPVQRFLFQSVRRELTLFGCCIRWHVRRCTLYSWV